MGEPRLSIETITPETAKAMLAQNTRNRHLRSKHVQHLAEAMRGGRWTMNGDTIRFNGNGELIDGQHRLAAVIESETPITTAVIRGLDFAAFDTIDTGAKRMAADALTIDGESSSLLLAASIGWHWRYTSRRISMSGGCS